MGVLIDPTTGAPILTPSTTFTPPTLNPLTPFNPSINSMKIEDETNIDETKPHDPLGEINQANTGFNADLVKLMLEEKAANAVDGLHSIMGRRSLSISNHSKLRDILARTSADSQQQAKAFAEILALFS